jgi:Rrf2 family protein
VDGLRGARGGYRLARPLAALTLSDVILAVDGPIALTACVDGASGSCDTEATCPVRGRWDPVNEAVRGALASITLADLAGPATRTCQSLGRAAVPSNPVPAMPASLAAE